MREHQARHQRPTAGFTIIELILAVAVLSVMGALAAPSFSGMIATSRVKGAATSLHVAMLKARSEAVKRNASVRVVRNGTNWGQGWRVLDAANNVLADQAAPANVTITPTTPATITYLRSGRLSGGAAPNFTLSTPKANKKGCVSVELSGLPKIRVKKATESC